MRKFSTFLVDSLHKKNLVLSFLLSIIISCSLFVSPSFADVEMGINTDSKSTTFTFDLQEQDGEATEVVDVPDTGLFIGGLTKSQSAIVLPLSVGLITAILSFFIAKHIITKKHNKLYRTYDLSVIYGNHARRSASFIAIIVGVVTTLPSIFSYTIPSFAETKSYTAGVNPFSITLSAPTSITTTAKQGDFLVKKITINVDTESPNGFTLSSVFKNTKLVSSTNHTIPSIDSDLSAEEFKALSTSGFGYSFDGEIYHQISDFSVNSKPETSSNLDVEDGNIVEENLDESADIENYIDQDGNLSLYFAIKTTEEDTPDLYVTNFDLMAETNNIDDLFIYYSISYNVSDSEQVKFPSIKELAYVVDGPSPITISTETPTRLGYTFLGWDTDALAEEPTYKYDSATQAVTPSTITPEIPNTILSPIWQKNNKTYALELKSNLPEGAELTDLANFPEAPAPITNNEGQATFDLSGLSTPTLTHYQFLGWSLNEDATSADFTTLITITEAEDKIGESQQITPLYVVWVEDKHYPFMLQFDLDGSTLPGNADASTLTQSTAEPYYDTTAEFTFNTNASAIPETKVVSELEAYDFIGWRQTIIDASGNVTTNDFVYTETADTVTGETVRAFSPSSITLDKDNDEGKTTIITLTAIWKKRDLIAKAVLGARCTNLPEGDTCSEALNADEDDTTSYSGNLNFIYDWHTIDEYKNWSEEKWGAYQDNLSNLADPSDAANNVEIKAVYETPTHRWSGYYSSSTDYNYRADITSANFTDDFYNFTPTRTAYWFNYDRYISSITNAENLNTSNVTNMSDMFSNAGSYATTWSIGDLSNWNTSNVTNMSDMFSNAGSYATTWSIGDLSNWNTSNVTNMSGMFHHAGYSAAAWNIGDLSNWNTSNVTNMSGMFNLAGYSAAAWNIGDLSNWNTSNVTNMSNMFHHAGYSAAAWNIGDLSSWDTSNITNMSGMFAFVGRKISIFEIKGLDSWDTSNVTNMSDMFSHTGQSATTWNIGDLSNWNTSSVTDMYGMFSSAGYSATTWNIGDLSGWNTSKVTTMESMFVEAGHNTKFDLDLSNWDISNVAKMQSMFVYSGIEHIYVSAGTDDWSKSTKLTNSASMFYGATKLKGGNETTYDSSHVDVSYAHIDTTGNPGYFTDVAYKPANTSTTSTIPSSTSGTSYTSTTGSSANTPEAESSTTEENTTENNTTENNDSSSKNNTNNNDTESEQTEPLGVKKSVEKNSTVDTAVIAVIVASFVLVSTGAIIIFLIEKRRNDDDDEE